MSFGFSVGDFLAVGKLVTDIVSCLKDTGGSRTEYQDLVRELECLQAALIHLDKLTATKTPHDLTAIKYTALSCRRPLEDFLARIRKYEGSLGIWSKGNPIKGVIDKIKLPLSHRDEVQRLQTYLSVHVGTINMLLAEHGLETMQLAVEKTETNHLQISKWIDSTGDLLGRMQRSVVSQSHAIIKSTAMLESVYKMLSGELKTSLQSLGNAVARVCVSTQQIYAVVLEIRTSITSAPDIRWTFLQDPFIVEDALGRKFPVPSEYDYSLLDVIIKHKFQDGPGAEQVAAGDYEIMDAKNRQHVLSTNSWLRPGCSITMAILVGRPHLAVLTDEDCPMPRCRSNNTIVVPGGGRQCCNCDVWFNQSRKRLSSLADFWAAYETLLTADQPSIDTDPDREKVSGKKRKRRQDDDFSAVPFKNVKLGNRETTPEVNPTYLHPAKNLPEYDYTLQFLRDVEVRRDHASTHCINNVLTSTRTSIIKLQKSGTDFITS
ncbi:hypothetical protein Hte_000222 [Hypoxylon texense]